MRHVVWARLTLLVGGEGQILQDIGTRKGLRLIVRLLQHASHCLVHPEHRVVVVTINVRLPAQLETVIRGHGRAATEWWIID